MDLRSTERKVVVERFGMHVTFEARPGERGALVEVLLDAARVLSDDHDCALYVVGTVPGEADHVCVTEIWTDEDAHARSLQDEQVRAVIQRGMPLVDQVVRQLRFEPAGGKIHRPVG